MERQEDKLRFFANYWGCSGLIKFPHENPYIDKITGITIENTQFINLKSISLISEEDARELSHCFQAVNEYGFHFHYGGSKSFEPDDVDYLRSKGYALPYMGLSVEKQVEYGWIKLEGHENHLQQTQR